MSSINVDPSAGDLLSKFKQVAADGLPKDESHRKELFEVARNLTFALESPADTLQRVIYLPLQLTVARIASDLHLFEAIAAGPDSGTSVDVLAKKTRTDPLLLQRMLRYMASIWMVKEVSLDHYGPSNITKTFSEPKLQAGIYHQHDTIQPAYQALPRFLADTKYQTPTEINQTAFQPGHHTDLLPFIWILSQPHNLAAFNIWMTSSREGMQIWLDVFNFEKELCQGSKPETPLFVDVGGGVGVQCVSLKQRLPQGIQGRIILQDQPPVVAQALKMEGVEAMAYDFWNPQPIEGARAYYFRNIMHDYPDYKAVTILRQTVTAMNSESVIILDDMVIPAQGAHWRATQLDLTMMTCLAGIERTMAQWEKLLDDAGLKVKQVKAYTEDLKDSIILAVKK